MAEFNPFHRWLGLDSKIKNPHHFQLLGVSPKVTDQDEIQKAVDRGVKKCLVGLSKVPDGKHAELVQKLKQRIVRARKTLLDPTLRIAYVAKLKQQIKAQQSAKLPFPKPTTNADVVPPSPPVHPQATNVAAAGSSPSVAAASPTFQPPSGTVSSDPPVPMAVPIMPVQQGQPVAVAPSAMSPPRDVAVNSDGAPIDEVKISKSHASRRKKSKLGLMVGLFMLVAAGVGAFLIYQNQDALFNLAGVDKDVPPAPGIIKDEKKETPNAFVPAIGGKADQAKNGSAKKGLPSLDMDSLPEVDEMAVLSHPETQAATMRNEKELAAVVANEEKRIGKPTDNGEMKPSSPASKNVDLEPSETEEPTGPLVKFDDFQLSKIRRHLERASRSLERNDLRVASVAIDYANSVRAEIVKVPNSRFNDDQAPIAKLVEETKEVHDLLVGFWEQVEASCEDIPGSQEIEASGQKIAFLESDETSVTVRHAGSNVKYDFSFCPPSLAVALAKQGAMADVPTWNKQLAAFYAVDQVVNGEDHSKIIDDLLKESENAGHDCDGIRHFAAFKFGNVGMPAKKIEMPNRRKFKEIIAEFRDENGYDDPGKISPGTGIVICELLLQLDSPNFDQHVALLEEFRRIGIQVGDASLTEDAIVELDKFAKIDRANLMGDSFLEIANGQPTSRQRRKLAERAIPFLKSELAENAKLKTRQSLAKKLLEFATAYNMVDIARRVNQISNLK